MGLPLATRPVELAASVDIAPVAPPTRLDAGLSPTHVDVGSSSTEDVVAGALDAIVLVDAGLSRGTGFFVSADTIVTNVHVIGRESSVTIRRADGRSAVARVAATAPTVDIAVLKVGPGDVSRAVLPLGSALSTRVGQDVLAIGSALGTLHNTVTRGIVSGVRRSGEVLLLQTDAAVNPGNSGGPLLDSRGTVLGVTTMGYVERQGLNFAVAADHVTALLDGRPVPATVAESRALSPASAVDGLSPTVASDSEQARTSGRQVYDETLRRAALQADGLDGDWQRYRSQCQVAAPAARLSREWFAVLAAAGTTGVVDPGCATWIADIRARAHAIGERLAQAEEAARRADVFPGIRRDLRRRYRLDFDGWDR